MVRITKNNIAQPDSLPRGPRPGPPEPGARASPAAGSGIRAFAISTCRAREPCPTRMGHAHASCVLRCRAGGWRIRGIPLIPIAFGRTDYRAPPVGTGPGRARRAPPARAPDRV